MFVRIIFDKIKAFAIEWVDILTVSVRGENKTIVIRYAYNITKRPDVKFFFI